MMTANCTNSPIWRSALADTRPAGGVWLRGGPRRLAGAWNLLRAVFAVWRARSDARRELARLDAAMLADVGLRAIDVERELDKAFWRP